MYGITTPAPSINFPMDGLVFCLFSVGVFLVERTMLGSGCLIGLHECGPFLLQGIQV